MKEIIYLDTDFIHSFLAQTSDGLPTSSKIELKEESVQQIKSEQGFQSKGSTEFQIETGKLSIPSILETPEGIIKVHIEPGNFSSESSFWSESDVGKEIISKQLHDNALINFENYLNEKKILEKVTEINGHEKYVEVDSTFELIDLNFFDIAFSEKMREIMIIEKKKEKDEALRKINSSPDINDKEKKRRRDELSRLFSNFEKQIEKEFPYYLDLIIFLKQLLPSSVFIKASNIIAPLKEEFMRESRNQLLFKYGNKDDGNKIKIIGKVTRQVKVSAKLETSYPNISDMFREYKGLLDELMVLHLELINENDYIINPIAVYFE